MTIKKALFFAFAAVILFVPVYVAVSSQNVLNNGKFYKFQLLASDPFDSFNGKHLRVNYNANNIPTEFDFEEGETVFVSITTDKDGFAFLEEAFKSPPKKKDYLKTTVEWVGINNSLREEIEAAIEEDDFDISTMDTRSVLRIKIPDNMSKFVINEEDAAPTEKLLLEKMAETYIGVRVLDGEARLDDIFVFEQPILDYLKKQ